MATIKRYLLKMSDGTFQIHNTEKSAKTAGMFSNKKFKVDVLDIELTVREIVKIQEETEKENILLDVLQILHNTYHVTEFDNCIEEDKEIIYNVFNKCEDSDLSHWENIEKTIDYLKDCSTVFDYNILK